jgi:hypothetical protein
LSFLKKLKKNREKWRICPFFNIVTRSLRSKVDKKVKYFRGFWTLKSEKIRRHKRGGF